jgi:sortase A
LNLRHSSLLSRAVLAPLLLCVHFTLSACGLTPDADDAGLKGATDASEKTAGVREEGASVRKAELTRAAQGQNATATGSGQAMDTAFVHRSDEKNSRGDYTYLSDPSIDGDPNAVVLVMPTPDQESTGDGIYDHNVGVWYEPQAQRWAIFNQDRVAVPAGTTFQVVVPGGPEKIVHRTVSGNIDENSTYLDAPLVNGKPGAILSVTQNWNPGGGSGTYNDHPVDVGYDTGRQQWAIYNTDDSAMPDGAAFNVAVSGVAPMTGSDAGDPNQAAKSDEESGSETTTEAVLPKDILDKKDLDKPPPKYTDWNKESSDSVGTETSGSSAGAIPAVKPFNLGKDPGGPDDKTLYLTVPVLGLTDVPVYNSVKDEKLKKSVVHIPASGFPWQRGANTYIAGHRVGYEGTGSYLVFYYLDMLGEGEEILLEDEAGNTYEYRVTGKKVVDPDNVEVMEPEEGKSLVSLQTCTLPDYKQRLILQGELVGKST